MFACAVVEVGLCSLWFSVFFVVKAYGFVLLLRICIFYGGIGAFFHGIWVCVCEEKYKKDS